MGRFINPKRSIITDPNGVDLVLNPDLGVPVYYKVVPLVDVIIKDPIGESVFLENGYLPTIIKNTSLQPVPVSITGENRVYISDQTTRAFSTRINKNLQSFVNLQESTIIGSYFIKLPGIYTTDYTGKGLALFLPIGPIPQLYFGTILQQTTHTGPPSYTDFYMDTPIPYVFPDTGTYGFFYDVEMNVDGSGLGQEKVYTLPNIFDVPLNITRLIPHILGKGGSSMDDAKFGSIPALPRGVVLRKKLIDDTYINYWTVHSNGEFRELAYDVTYIPPAPSGSPGFGCRLTYGGQDKHGVVIELLPGEEIQMIIQDDLTDLDSFRCMFEGHADGPYL